MVKPQTANSSINDAENPLGSTSSAVFTKNFEKESCSFIGWFASFAFDSVEIFSWLFGGNCLFGLG